MRVSRILFFHSLNRAQTTAGLFSIPVVFYFLVGAYFLGSSLSPSIDVDVFTHFLGFSDRGGLPAEILCYVPALFVERTALHSRRFSPVDDPSQRREVMI